MFTRTSTLVRSSRDKESSQDEIKEMCIIKGIEVGKLPEYIIVSENKDEPLCKKTKRTALMYCSIFEQDELIEKLIDAGCDLTKKDIFGRNSIDYASQGTLSFINKITNAKYNNLKREHESLEKENHRKKRKIDDMTFENNQLKKNKIEIQRENYLLQDNIEKNEEIIEKMASEEKRLVDELSTTKKAFMTLRNSK